MKTLVLSLKIDEPLVTVIVTYMNAETIGPNLVLGGVPESTWTCREWMARCLALHRVLDLPRHDSIWTGFIELKCYLILLLQFSWAPSWNYMNDILDLELNFHTTISLLNSIYWTHELFWFLISCKFKRQKKLTWINILFPFEFT